MTRVIIVRFCMEVFLYWELNKHHIKKFLGMGWLKVITFWQGESVKKCDSTN